MLFAISSMESIRRVFERVLELDSLGVSLFKLVSVAVTGVRAPFCITYKMLSVKSASLAFDGSLYKFNGIKLMSMLWV